MPFQSSTLELAAICQRAGSDASPHCPPQAAGSAPLPLAALVLLAPAPVPPRRGSFSPGLPGGGRSPRHRGLPWMRLGPPRPGSGGARATAGRPLLAAPLPDARGERFAEYRVALGRLGRGSHRLEPRLDRKQILAARAHGEPRSRASPSARRAGQRRGKAAGPCPGARSPAEHPRPLQRRSPRDVGRDRGALWGWDAAALLGRVQQRGRRHAPRSPDGYLGPPHRPRVRLRRGARSLRPGDRRAVPGPRAQAASLRRAPRGRPSGALRRHRQQHGERPRQADPAFRTGPRELRPVQHLARGA